jgi:hypothetical protein
MIILADVDEKTITIQDIEPDLKKAIDLTDQFINSIVMLPRYIGRNYDITSLVKIKRQLQKEIYSQSQDTTLEQQREFFQKKYTEKTVLIKQKDNS